MAQKTDLELITESNIIRDETAIGANTALRVGTMFDNLVDSKINNDRVSDSTSLGNSTTLVPSQNAVKTYVDAFATGLLTDNGNYDPTITDEYPTSGDTLSGGAVQRGDIWYISVDGTMNGNAVLVGYSVRALVDNAGATTDANWSISNVGIGFVPENVANKSTDVNLGTSDVYYPSQNAVKTYVDTEVAAAVPFTPENVANKSQDIVSSPSSTVLYPSNKAVVDYITLGIDLQAVTDSGNTTTVDIHVESSITSENTTDSASAYLNNSVGDSGILGITNAAGDKGEIGGLNLTADRAYEFPDASGTLALKVNGVAADSTGNIVVSAGGSVNTIKVSLTSANILALNATPFTLIAAQGAGTIVNVLKVWYSYNHNTTAYTGGGFLTVKLGSAFGATISGNIGGILNSGSNIIGMPSMSVSSSTGTSGFDNTAVVLYNTSAQTLGDGTLDVYLTYDVITL
jgi:hypothetical protein